MRAIHSYTYASNFYSILGGIPHEYIYDKIFTRCISVLRCIQFFVSNSNLMKFQLSKQYLQGQIHWLSGVHSQPWCQTVMLNDNFYESR